MAAIEEMLMIEPPAFASGLDAALIISSALVVLVR